MIHPTSADRGPLRAAVSAPNPSDGSTADGRHRRRGAFMVLAVFTLIVTMGFVAFSIDTGHVALNKTIMQNAVDAAALAAAMEIAHAIENAPPEAADPTEFAREQAKIVAADTATMNGAYVDPSMDVTFGLRSYNPATESFEIQWGVEPANAVKVRSRREDDDTTQPDGKLPVLFAGVLGAEATSMSAEAIAYIEARDIAVVLDFSGSMRYDSLFFQESVNKLGVSAIEQNLEQIYSELGLADGDLGTLDHVDPDNPNSLRNGDAKWLTVHGATPSGPGEAQIDVTFRYGEVDVTSTEPINQIRLRFSNGAEETISGLSTTNDTLSGSGSNSGREIDHVWATYADGDGDPATVHLRDSNWEVKKYFQLTSTTYPFNYGSWDSYIDYVRSDSDINRGHLREMYGGSTLAHYLLENYPRHDQTPELARTSHYPFHAVRKGNELFVDFLENLSFGDHVGLVSYDQRRRMEELLIEDDRTIDLTYDPLDDHYADLKTIMQYKQASNYYSRTNIGGGLREARQMIKDHGRPGARPTILLMTDGNANVHENEAGVNSLESNFVDDDYYQLPSDFDWSQIDFGDGTEYEIEDDGSYQNKARLYALSQAVKAVDEGVTVHTLAVGAGADRDLMRAIAIIGGGEYISVAGDLSVDDLLDEVEAGFYRVAARVPPARLANPDEETN